MFSTTPWLSGCLFDTARSISMIRTHHASKKQTQKPLDYQTFETLLIEKFLIIIEHIVNMIRLMFSTNDCAVLRNEIKQSTEPGTEDTRKN